MKEIKVTTTISFQGDGEIKTETKTTAAGVTDNESEAAAGYHICSDDEEMTEEEAERYAVASDLADVCDYLEDSEVIRIRLIVSKAQERKRREEQQ